MVVLIVDALGWELAARHPELAPSLGHRRRLETILGFSSGALPTLFTGKLPREHGRWLMYRRAAGRSPFSGFQWVRALPPAFRGSGTLSRLLTRTVESRGVRGYFHLYDVPRWLLPEFDLAEREDIFRPGGLPVDALWDTLERMGIRWRGWNWRTSEADNLRELEQCVTAGEERVMVCYTADLDARLHREGPAGPGVGHGLERYAALLERIESAAARNGTALWIYLVSDHGMVEVRATADVMGRLERLDVRWPDDYLAFFDSTMARFWWRSPHARREVVRALADERGGAWLDDAALAREGADFPAREYGDAIFLLHPGVLMVPSFMGRNPLRAMHGYDPSHPDMAALLWSNRPVPERVRHLKDVREFLESELQALVAGAA
jgi:hypothetical protein